MKRYFIWKDAAHAGEEDNWLEISGRKFCELIKKPENCERRFIFVPSDDEIEDEFYYETTPERYNEWHKEYMCELRKKDYKIKHPIEFVSLDMPMFDEEGEETTLGDLLPSSDYDDYIEQEELEEQLSLLRKALAELSDEEMYIINRLFLDNPKGKSERDIAAEMGIPRMTLNSRKKKIFEKIKKYFVQN